MDLLISIPGISRLTAEVIIAETGGDMSRFPSAAHLAAWAGVAPANAESAGKRHAAGSRHGAQWLRRALAESAKAASRGKDTYLAAQYRRIARRRGPTEPGNALVIELPATASRSLRGYRLDDLRGGA